MKFVSALIALLGLGFSLSLPLAAEEITAQEAEKFIQQEISGEIVVKPGESPEQDARDLIVAAHSLRQILAGSTAAYPDAGYSPSRLGYRINSQGLRYKLTISGEFTANSLRRLFEALTLVATDTNLDKLNLQLEPEDFELHLDFSRDWLKDAARFKAGLKEE